jgi:hypothetical protein
MAGANNSKAKVTSQVTDYVVLEQRTFDDGEGNAIEAWVEAGNASATSRTGAVKEVVGKEREGLWRPVPLRNWSDPIRTRLKVEPQMEIEVEPVVPF